MLYECGADVAIPCSSRQGGFYAVIQSKRCFAGTQALFFGEKEMGERWLLLVNIAQRGISGNREALCLLVAAADVATLYYSRQGFYAVIQSKRSFVLRRRCVPGNNDCRNAGPWLVIIAQRGISGKERRCACW